MPVNYDLNIIKGSTFSARVIASNADGSAVDLTNYQTRGYVKQRYSDTGILLDLQPVPTPNYQTSGYIDILVPSTGTEALPVTQGVYDIEMYGPTPTENFVIKLLDGRVNIHPEATTIYTPPASNEEQSSAGTGTTTTTIAPGTTTTTTSTTTTAAPSASITIVAPAESSYVSFDFNLEVGGNGFSHWHWVDSESSVLGFDNYAVGQSVQNVGTMVTPGILIDSITSSDLPGGSAWGPGTLYVVAVDENHLVLPDSNGAPAKDHVVISLI